MSLLISDHSLCLGFLSCCWEKWVFLFNFINSFSFHSFLSQKNRYLEAVDSIVKTVKSIERGVCEIDGLRIVGDTEAMIVCFDSPEVNIIKVADRMAKREWALNSLKDPLCVHICVTLRHVGKQDEFLQDLRECVEEEREDGDGVGEEGSFAQIYGVTESLPGGPVSELMKTYQDVLLSVD